MRPSELGSSFNRLFSSISDVKLVSVSMFFGKDLILLLPKTNASSLCRFPSRPGTER